MLNLLQDLKYSFRLLLRQPLYTAIAVLTIALGIGANSAIFSVVNTVLLRPLPYPEPDRLVVIWESVQRTGALKNVSAPGNVLDFQKENKSFVGVAAYTADNATLTGAGDPESLPALDVTPNFFQVLGITPAGRNFLPEEGATDRNDVAIVSHRLWQRRFNHDPQLIGKKITIEGSARTIVGILPRDFYFPDAENVDIVLPLSLPPNARGSHYLQVFGRLKNGTSINQAQAEANTIAKRFEEAYPTSNVGVGMNLVSFRDEVIGDIKPALLMLFGAVAFILLIACANVANLLLSRAVSRQREIALRTALGASRARIIRQLLTESVLLSLIGGVLGLFLAVYGIDSLVAIGAGQIPHASAIGLDGYVVGFTFGAALLTGLVFGLIPALQVSRPNLAEALKSSGRGLAGGASQNRSRSALIIAEIALSLMLLVGAGLILKSFRQLQTVDLGFSPDNVLTVGFSLPTSRYNSRRDGQGVSNFYQKAVDQIKTLPGVESVSVAAWLPISGSTASRRFAIEGQPVPEPGSEPTAIYNIVSSDYFPTLNIGLVKGRYFTEFDSANSPLVMIVSESTARKVFPNEDPLGKRISYYEAGTFRWREIVGVVKDIRHSNVKTEPRPETYVPHLQTPTQSMTLMVRTNGDPTQVISGVRDQIRLIDKDLPLYQVRPMTQIISESLAKDRFNMLLMTIFAAVALILAMVGVYGSMSYSVTQSTQEIGIRLALGGQPSDMLKLIIGQGMILTIAGVAIGLGGAFLLTGLIEKLLYQVSVTDPMTFAVIPLLLVLVALLACYIPARRATRVDPMIALRYD